MGAYDVFISHCGADCKRDFAVWLKEELERVGVRCFFDEHSLEVGDVGAEAMLHAMNTATYGIVILSPGFFSREWCMKEMQTFLDAGRIVPIFYGRFEEVQAARRAAIEGRVWETFKKFVRTEDEYRQVAEANTKHNGVRLAELGWWSSCIRKVRDEVLRLLGKAKGGLRISEDELLVGQAEHLIELKRLLGLPQEGVSALGGDPEAAASQEVGIVGVKGMGGVGKTTLAKKLYDEQDVREWFADGVCWLEVGPNPSDGKVQHLQKQILKELGGLDEEPWNPTRGRELIRQRLAGKKVLICLDDVWEPVSTSTPVVNARDLGAGSRILKTSRVKGAVGGDIHDLDCLDEEPAWELFCWHAFGGDRPPSSLALDAKRASERCGGLPLALKVLGRQVASADDKTQCLATFLDLPSHDEAMVACQKIIRTSYENLPLDRPGLRDVFVLIAGVWPHTVEFRAYDKAVENVGAAVYGANVVESLNLARIAMKRLSSLSLIGLNLAEDNETLIINVHDLVVNVAQRLADTEEQGPRRFYRQAASDNRLRLPQNSSRLEHLSFRSGSVAIQGLKAAYSLVLESGETLLANASDDSGRSSGCRLLVVEGGLASGFHNMTNLQCLRLRRCPFAELPPGTGCLDDLRVLDLESCWALRSLPPSIEGLTGLKSLYLSWCVALQNLPKSLGALTGLTRLDLSGCRELKNLPESIGALTGLTSLDCNGCGKLQSLPKPIGGLTGLTRMDLTSCETLQSLPDSIEGLTRLTSLVLDLCTSVRSVPGSIGALTQLTNLNLSECMALQSLPESIGALTGFTALDLVACGSLQSLPESIGGLTRLTSLDLSNCVALQSLPKSIVGLTGLASLDVSGCKRLQSLPELFGALTGLTRLDFTECYALQGLPKSIGGMTGLTSLEMPFYVALQSSPESLGALTALKSLSPNSTRALQTRLKYVGALTDLKVLRLGWCCDLRSLPEWIGGQLTGLTGLDLSGCAELRGLPESIGGLTGLTSLDLKTCRALQSLPETIGRLTTLRILDLTACRKLRSLPESIVGLTGLTSLNLFECHALQSLPETIGGLTALRRLNLNRCKRLRSLPASLVGLTNLTSLSLTGCKELDLRSETVSRLMRLPTLEIWWGILRVDPDFLLTYEDGAYTGRRRTCAQS